MSDLNSRSEMRRLAVQNPDALVEEIERLRVENARLKDANTCDACGGSGAPISSLRCACDGSGLMSVAARCYRERMDELHLQAHRAEAENARLREALEWYADETNYFGDDGALIDGPKGNSWPDLGQRARAALAGEKDTK